MGIPQLLMKGLMSVASSTLGGNSGAMTALNQAVSMSNQFKPNMDGAIQIAQKFGFNSQQMAALRAAALNNASLVKGIESVVPGATDKLVNMSKELESKLTSTPTQSQAPTPMQDDVSQRLSRIRF